MLVLDESNCSVINFGDGVYRSQNPDIQQGSTNVSVNMSMMYIDDIDENMMKMSVKVLLQLKWFDSRLIYRNLNSNLTYGSNLDKDQRDQVNLPIL